MKLLQINTILSDDDSDMSEHSCVSPQKIDQFKTSYNKLEAKIKLRARLSQADVRTTKYDKIPSRYMSEKKISPAKSSPRSFTWQPSQSGKTLNNITFHNNPEAISRSFNFNADLSKAIMDLKATVKKNWPSTFAEKAKAEGMRNDGSSGYSFGQFEQVDHPEARAIQIHSVDLGEDEDGEHSNIFQSRSSLEFPMQPRSYLPAIHTKDSSLARISSLMDVTKQGISKDSSREGLQAPRHAGWKSHKHLLDNLKDSFGRADRANKRNNAQPKFNTENSNLELRSSSGSRSKSRSGRKEPTMAQSASRNHLMHILSPSSKLASEKSPLSVNFGFDFAKLRKKSKKSKKVNASQGKNPFTSSPQSPSGPVTEKKQPKVTFKNEKVLAPSGRSTVSMLSSASNQSYTLNQRDWNEVRKKQVKTIIESCNALELEERKINKPKFQELQKEQVLGDIRLEKMY